MGPSNNLFLPARRNATRGIVAGAIAGGLLTFTFLLRTATWLIADSRWSDRVQYAALATVLAAFTIQLTWRRNALGPVIGLCISVGFVFWMLLHSQFVALGLITPIIIGGFLRAARSIQLLTPPGKWRFS